MKTSLSFPALFGLLMFSMIPQSHAETYHGDFCWQVLINEVPAWTYQFGVYQKDGGHYALYGREDNGLGEITAAHGNAAIVGDQVKMTIQGSGHTEAFGAWHESVSAVLEAATLSGTWHALGVSTDSGTPLQFHSNGNIRLIACP